jgi:hypothetical protein
MEFKSQEDLDYYIHEDPAHLATLAEFESFLKEVNLLDFVDGVW